MAGLGPSAAAAQRHHRPYRQAVSEALREFRAGRWEEARALFQRAHEIRPNARTLRGIGMASFEMRDYVSAYRSLMQSLASDVRPLSRRQRRSAQALIERTRTFMGRFMVTVSPPEAELSVDLRPARLEDDGYLLLSVGEHTLSATLDGYLPSESRLVVEGSEDEEIHIALGRRPAEPVATPAQRDARPGRGNTAMVLMMTAGGLGVAAAGGLLWMVDRISEVGTCRAAGRDCINLPVLRGERTASVAFTVATAIAAAAAAAVGLYVMLMGEHEVEAEGADRAPGGAEEGEDETPPDRAGAAGLTIACTASPLGAACAGHF